MSFNNKVNIGIFSFMFLFYLGVAIVANAYLWFITILLLSIGVLFFHDKLIDNGKDTKFIRFFPILIVALFIFANESSRSYLADNPQSISLYIDENTDEERVLVKYGIYGSLTFETINRHRDLVDLNVTSSGYELAEPLNPRFEVFVAIYIFIGIPLILNAIISVLNQTRSISKKITDKENLFKVIMSSGDRFSSHHPKTNHIQYQQSFNQEDAKKEMVKDVYKHREDHDESPNHKKKK